jgi:hypothetical protein
MLFQPSSFSLSSFAFIRFYPADFCFNPFISVAGKTHHFKAFFSHLVYSKMDGRIEQRPQIMQ